MFWIFYTSRAGGWENTHYPAVFDPPTLPPPGVRNNGFRATS